MERLEVAAKFGVPPEGEKIRSLVQERVVQAKTDGGGKVTVDWRAGEQRFLDVISMPVNVLYFNPDTHRIRAQRTTDPNRNRVLEEDPWGQAAQDYLRDLLTWKPANPGQIDPEYTDLLEELNDFGQKEPGIITPDGILVDGNTRCAALRELGVKDIRVGVLPNDTSRDDVNAVELSLQLRRDKRRDYSYINRLIAIEDELASGRNPADIARAFNIKGNTLQQDRWVYQLILDAIERSKSDNGAALRLVDFEGHQETLRELHRDFSKLAKTDPNGADQLKETRLAMVVLGYAKTAIRLAEADFHSRYLDQRLPATLKIPAQAPAPVAIPGLPGVALPDAPAGVKTTRALTDMLLKAQASVESASKLTPTEVAFASTLITDARETFKTAVRLAGQNAQITKHKVQVQERLTDAADYVNQCAAEFVEAKAKRVLDEESFDDALLTLRSSLATLAKHAGRTFTTPGSGVAWLLAAVRDDS
ncbi:transcriptional regulator [Catellatospora aurea]|uniref:Transcriptional regulator n=1 Tax=Catellatospora aurea TaxID=1337874 RepID=A0ABW2GR57_9ACTN